MNPNLKDSLIAAVTSFLIVMVGLTWVVALIKWVIS